MVANAIKIENTIMIAKEGASEKTSSFHNKLENQLLVGQII
jgi:hypothetical protein